MYDPQCERCSRMFLFIRSASDLCSCVFSIALLACLVVLGSSPLKENVDGGSSQTHNGDENTFPIVHSFSLLFVQTRPPSVSLRLDPARSPHFPMPFFGRKRAFAHCIFQSNRMSLERQEQSEQVVHCPLRCARATPLYGRVRKRSIHHLSGPADFDALQF
jgi:hypothetical protein